MSLLVIGVSHSSAPITLLEAVMLDAGSARALGLDACRSGLTREAMVLATCNRLELYADVESFHPALAALTGLLARATGMDVAQLAPHLTFSHADAAVEHLFTVAAGLDSMAVGETQVTAQVRAALRRGQEDSTVGRVLDPLVQHALRASRRVHSESGIDGVTLSLVDRALAEAGMSDDALGKARVLVVGTGAMGALVSTTLSRRDVAELTLAGRSPARTARLATSTGARALSLTDSTARSHALSRADVVVSCSGATGYVLTVDELAAADAVRRASSRPGQVLVDLALPRDIEPAAAGLAGVRLIALEDLQRLRTDGQDPDAVTVLAQAKAIVGAEVAAYQRARAEAEVTPVVAALRERARSVMDAELDRLRGRLAAMAGGQADPRVVNEVERSLHRVVEKLLHTPSVRVKALAGSDEGDSYAQALWELFDLREAAEQATVAGSVTQAQSGAAATATAAGVVSLLDALHAGGAPR